jgi:transcriptional regulator of arginine metabolism
MVAYAGMRVLCRKTAGDGRKEAGTRISTQGVMDVKARRQAKILEIIKNHVIETQEELAEALGREGIPVTQATISRDIKELQLNKVPTGDGRYRYAIPEEFPSVSWDKRRRIFQESVLSVDYSENIIIVKSLPGTAPGVGSAIDHLGWPELIGSVAGDDTVMVVVKPKEATAEVAERIRGLMR